MTRRGAIVGGRVLDAAGKGTDAAYIWLVSADPLRRQFGLGTVKTTRPKPDGSFTVGAVRAGEYVIIATTPETAKYLSLPDVDALERVVQAGERIVLVEGEKRDD